MENEEIKQNLQNSHSWIRGLYMLLFAVFYGLAETIILLIAFFQFVSHLVTKKVNQQLVSFGASLALYIFEIMQYLTFNQHEKPFPFSEWPSLPTGNNTDAPS